MWSDRLTSKEADRTQWAINELSTVPWAKPLLLRLERAGGLKSENMSLMFEVRFAHELYRAGVSAEYEYPAGVGDSTVEFRTNTSPPWLIELVSVRTSNAAKRAIRQTGLIYEQLLAPTREDPARSEEAEMITAEQKIGEKAFADGKPTKFPSIVLLNHLLLRPVPMELGGGKTERTQKRKEAAFDMGEGLVDRKVLAQMCLPFEPDILRGILLWSIGRK